MRPAPEITQIRPDLWFWQTYDPAVKCDLSSCAIRTQNGELVVIDPVLLSNDAFAELTRIAAPAAVVVTNVNHARAAAWFRKSLSVPLLTHPEARADLGVDVDAELVEGEPWLDGLTPIAISGAPPGELAIHCASGALVIGDALIHFPPHGFALLPDKYCTDPPAMRTALRKLLRFDFEVLTFAHGFPLVARARQRLEALIA